jgi:hypothetical protein
LQKAKAWEIGETATGWLENRVPVKEWYNTEKAQYERIWFDGTISVGVDSVHGQAEE